MVKKEYTILSDSPNKLLELDKNLKVEGLRFHLKTSCEFHDKVFPEYGAIFNFNISPDMVQEVEDLIMEIAKKSGVKVE